MGAWGEGLVDRSLTTLWYPTDWSEVGDDELVFLLPTLSTWRSAATPSTARGRHGPARYLTRVLAARAQAAAGLIAANSSSDATATPALALEAIVSRGILAALPLQELAAVNHGTRKAPHAPIADTAQDPALPDWLLLELTAIAHLDRMLIEAREEEAACLVDWPVTLADVVIASINARLNGVYVYPEFAHAHELLTAAALLGHLACGRAAHVPPGVGKSLIDILSRKGKPANGAAGGCAAIVRLYAELSGGTQGILAIARRAAQSGCPHVAQPRAPAAPSDTGRTTWNSRLAQRIARRWNASA